MILYHMLVLSFIQGLTEFLPVSSSGHLIIIPKLLGWPDQGLAMDVAVHLGTLLAVIIYFWRDLWTMTKGFIVLLQGKPSEGGRLALHLILATLPAVVGGALVSYYSPSFFRTLTFVGSTTLLFGLLLGFVDAIRPQKVTLKDLTFMKSFLIGLAQALALMPGTSRSGICMTMGRWLGLHRTEAARFAFLLSIPTIIGAGVHTGVKLHLKGLSFLTPSTLLAVGSSCAFGLMAIYFMMHWLKKSGFTPFVIYRIILGLVLIGLA